MFMVKQPSNCFFIDICASKNEHRNYGNEQKYHLRMGHFNNDSNGTVAHRIGRFPV